MAVNSAVLRLIWPNFELVLDFVVVLVTCKDEEDSNKHEGARVVTFSHYKSMGIFPDTQGQLTPQSMVRSGRILNLFEMEWLSSLPARMKQIQSKMKVL